MDKTVKAEFVVLEGELKPWRNALKKAGAEVSEERPFTPPPEELDRFADAQFEPLMVIAAAISLTAFLQQVMNLVDRLRGEEVLLVDAANGPLKIRRVPRGRATEIAVVHKGGVEHFPLHRKDQALSFLRDLLK